VIIFVFILEDTISYVIKKGRLLCLIPVFAYPAVPAIASCDDWGKQKILRTARGGPPQTLKLN